MLHEIATMAIVVMALGFLFETEAYLPLAKLIGGIAVAAGLIYYFTWQELSIVFFAAAFVWSLSLRQR